MRYNSKSLQIKVVISENDLLFKDIKISLGLLITARKMPALFGKTATLRCQQMQIIQLISAAEPKIPGKS